MMITHDPIAQRLTVPFLSPHPHPEACFGERWYDLDGIVQIIFT